MTSSRKLLLSVAGLVAILLGGAVILRGRSRPEQATTPRQNGRTPAESFALSANPLVAITEMGAQQLPTRSGRTYVAVRVGVAPRGAKVKGEVEVKFFFFDLSPAKQLQPTDAEVQYRWLTPVRDWSDPAPKFLFASYHGVASSSRPEEKSRFGGFLVRVLVDGQIQDERSEPAEIAAAVRSGVRPIVVSNPLRLATPSASELAAALQMAEPNRDATGDSLTDVSETPNTAPAAPPAALIASRAPFANPAPGKPGFVYSPYDEKFLIDVRGFPPGTELQDPNTGKPLRVP
ncbi:MAG: hypothetical protein ABI946_08850 [Chthoniobacterales bacterium]